MGHLITSCIYELLDRINAFSKRLQTMTPSPIEQKKLECQISGGDSSSTLDSVFPLFSPFSLISSEFERSRVRYEKSSLLLLLALVVSSVKELRNAASLAGARGVIASYDQRLSLIHI